MPTREEPRTSSPTDPATDSTTDPPTDPSTHATSDPAHNLPTGRLPIDHQTALEAVVRLFAGWGSSVTDIEYILHNAIEVRTLGPRETLFQQDTPLRYVYLLLYGRLFQERMEEVTPAAGGIQSGGIQSTGKRAPRHRITLRREVNPGELVAHFDLLYGRDHSTRARALEHCGLIAIDAQAMNRLIHQHPKLRRHIAPLERISRLRTMPFFCELDLTAISYLATDTQIESFKADQEIYQPNDLADRIYIIDQGQVRLTSPGGQEQLLGNGMAFGFLDYIHPDPPRDGERRFEQHAVATTATTAFSLSRNGIMDLTSIDLERHGLKLRKACVDMVDHVPVFAQFSQDERRSLLGYMSHYHVPIHHLVTQQGEMGDSLWMLMPGGYAVLRALEGGEALQPTPVAGPNYFGELALRVDRSLDSTIQAEPNSQWLRLHRDDFQAFLKHHGKELQAKLSLSPAAERYLGQHKTRIRYAWLDEDEQLITRQRRHWFILTRKAIIPMLLVGAWALAALLFWPRAWISPWQLTLMAFPGVLFGSILLWSVVDYINDYMLVTSQRIVRQEKIFMVMEWRQGAFLDQIRNIDVSYSFMGRVLKFGNLTVHTAAMDGAIHFDAAPDPIDLKTTILEQVNIRKQHQEAASKMVIQNLLEERLGLRLQIPPRVRGDYTADSQESRLPKWLQRQYRRLHIDVNLRRQEADRIVWRKHWFVLMGRLATPVSILIGILVVIAVGHLLPPPFNQLAILVDVIGGVLGLGMAIWASWNFADWRNDTYEVSEREVADVRKKPLFFSEQRRTAPLDEIENIEVSIPSPLHYILNFGNVRLQTAAAEGEFSFDWVPFPRDVADELRRRMAAYRQVEEINIARRRNQELPDWFEMYSRLSADNVEIRRRV